MRLSRLALAATLILGVSGFALAQDHDRGHDNNREERSEAYQDGFRDGQRDRTHHHAYRIPNGGRWEDRSYRETYEHGYRAGYGEVHDRDHDGDRDHDRDDHREPVAAPAWGRPAPGPMGNQPYKIGYNDGMQQGLGDKNNGHSFRPTQHGYYSDGDHGYSSAWGDKNQYKAQYRQGYLAGYQRGYNGR